MEETSSHRLKQPNLSEPKAKHKQFPFTDSPPMINCYVHGPSHPSQTNQPVQTKHRLINLPIQTSYWQRATQISKPAQQVHMYLPGPHKTHGSRSVTPKVKAFAIHQHQTSDKQNETHNDFDVDHKRPYGNLLQNIDMP